MKASEKMGFISARARRQKKLLHLYDLLIERHGPQGWWPVLSLAGESGLDDRGYHPGSFAYPETEAQRFEVILGAILTQNTAWTNVEKALRALQENGLLHRESLARLSEARLETLIRPSGYFRQKARKIRAMMEFLQSRQTITRESLLGIWGVGPETADSILLYAYHQASFVVDAYTRRILERLEVVGAGASYDEIQTLFHAALPVDVTLYNEYHALIVAHGKRHYSRQPYGDDDPLLRRLERGRRKTIRRRNSPR